MRLVVIGALVMACSDGAPSPTPTPSPGPSPSPSTSTNTNATTNSLTGTGKGCVVALTKEKEEATRDELRLFEAEWKELEGWQEDKLAEAVPAFLKSCEVLAQKADGDKVGVPERMGTAKQWRAACAGAAKVKAGDDAAARAFFEAEFTPWRAEGKKGPVGKLTGYYVQAIRASRTKQGAYQYPILGRPSDLVVVDLNEFLGDSRRVWGRVEDGKLVPYATRAEIRRGALDGRGLELMYADNPVDALFADVQGSAIATMDDGTRIPLEFAGKNGCTFRGVGKLLRDMAEIPQGQSTMQGIRAWFAAHPDRFDEIADQNPSKVFWAVSKRDGAVGSQGVVLTPLRSIAIDRAFLAQSTPVWIDGDAPRGTGPFRRLLIAQDTGGGILGPVRADIYFGADATAADLAGRMGGPGRAWLLLPRSVKP